MTSHSSSSSSSSQSTDPNIDNPIDNSRDAIENQLSSITIPEITNGSSTQCSSSSSNAATSASGADVDNDDVYVHRTDSLVVQEDGGKSRWVRAKRHLNELYKLHHWCFHRAYSPWEKDQSPEQLLEEQASPSAIESTEPIDPILAAPNPPSFDESVIYPSPVDTLPAISLHAFTGQFVPRTLKVAGSINGHSVVALIDGWSTRNFIQTRLAKHLGLTIQPSPHLQVTVGNGDTVGCVQQQINLGHKPFVIDLFLLPIYGPDIVLGVEWLATLGPIVFDYKNLYMEINDNNGTVVRFPGLVNPTFSQISLSQLQKAETQDAVVSFFHLQVMEESPEPTSPPLVHQAPTPTLDEALKQLLVNTSWELHLQHLETMFSILESNCFFAKQSKCEFGSSSVSYLGHIVSSDGVSVDPTKVKAIKDWPLPKNLKQLRGFLGLAGYYRHFIAHYASLAASLTPLLRKDAFVWSEFATTAFNNLKQALMQTDGHPIAYFSKQMSLRLQQASTYVREMFAITEGVKRWRQYLLGRPFHIQTDHQSLRSIVNQTIQTPEQYKWLSKLLSYDFTITYRLDNGPADALSCVSQATVLVVVDRLFKHGHFCPLGQNFTAPQVAEDYLRCFTSHNPRTWLRYLPWAEWCYNTSWHSTIKMTPFEAVYGRSPPSLLDYIAGTSKVDAVDALLQSRTELISQLQSNIHRAQLCMCNQANAHRTDVEFQVDDWVFVKLQPYRQSSVALRQSHKLSKRFFGPFRIVERIGPVAYRLDLPEESQIHNVFHISVLKKCNGDPLSQQQPLPPHFIGWQQQHPSEATWEPLEDFRKDFPSFNLEDKVFLDARGNDASQLSKESRNQVNRSTRVTRVPARLMD
nr:reverse transcriptase [Tanacetum cinerariifolium]